MFCFALCLALLLAGCAPLTMQNINDLLRAPELGQGQGEVQKALAAYLGEQPEYKYPKEGGMRSPLIVEDLNGDGVNEGILLYSLANSSTPGRSGNVYVAVLEQQEDEWVVTQDLEGAGSEVASFELADLFDNGQKQIVVGYASANLNTKIFSLYEYADGQLADLIYPAAYSRYELADFSGQGGMSLVIVSPDDQLGGLNLQYIPPKEGVLDLSLTPIKLDTNFSSCAGIYPSSSSEGQLLVVDGVTETQVLASEILHFSGEHFFKVDDGGTIVGETARTNPLLNTRDIDGDEVVEIPRRVGMTEIVTLAGDKHLEYVEWMDFTTEEPKSKQFGIVDSDKGVYIRLPEPWRENIRIEDGKQSGEWSIRDTATRATLLTLEIFDGGQAPPMDAILVSRISDAYLVLSSSLPSYERNTIAVVSLT
ncbi:hypothetical protein LJC49_03550 [Ruminococcaceae bacterium OttesenSCG-928-I18]|nr:hypothetical protein [Ruminococcaceae bacterium OttesenSCG-928-I18]